MTRAGFRARLDAFLGVGPAQVSRRSWQIVRAAGALEAEVRSWSDERLLAEARDLTDTTPDRPGAEPAPAREFDADPSDVPGRGGPDTDPAAARPRAEQTPARAPVPTTPVPTPESLTRMLALGREAARRELGLRVHDVQLAAVLALLAGRIAQLDTGEGKTLVGALGAFALTRAGHTVHCLAVNDYLARRDAQWMGPLLARLGVDTTWIDSRTPAAERPGRYAAQVLYVPATETGFDALRDGLVADRSERVCTRRDAAIVDEADSVMVDQARHPLVLAGTGQEAGGDVGPAEAVRHLAAGRDYEVSAEGLAVYLTSAGERRVERALGADLYGAADDGRTLTAVNLALHAQVLLQRDVDYIVRDGRVKLVDVSRGRVADLQRWPDGLQAAVEAKEHLAASEAGVILDSTTIPDLLGTYALRSGMTGTAAAAAREFDVMYAMTVEVVPPNVPSRRVDEPARIYLDEASRTAAVLDRVRTEHATGRPILLATGSIAESERIGGLLEADGVAHVVLNAKNDAAEAAVIADAGRPGAVTVSTQMAGRGVDIRLGGTQGEGRSDGAAGLPDAASAGTPSGAPEIADGATADTPGRAPAGPSPADLGGLLVLGMGPQASTRLDDQLRGRAGRQGDPGASAAYVALTDPIVARVHRGGAGPAGPDGRVTSRGLADRVDHARRVAEGQDVREFENTRSYSRIVHGQRALVLREREDLLDLGEPERTVRLHTLDEAWSDHLALLAALRESTPLRAATGLKPLDEYNREAIAAFEGLIDGARERAEAILAANPDGVDALGLRRPGATWTYVVEDNPFGASVDRLVAAARRVLGVEDRD